MLKHAFIQKVILVATKRNAYGDIVPNGAGQNRPVYCRFRVIDERTKVNNREELRSDAAMVWFDPSENIDVNDIILYESRYWEVIRINEARRMGHTKVEFLKCYVAAHDMVS